MHRLLAKVHKGDHHKAAGHSSQAQQDQHCQSDLLRKDVRRVSIVDDSKENIPADPFHDAAAEQQSLDHRSILSSSLPTTPAESALPFISRRSSASDDHHLKAFEASAPGRLALSIAPQLGEAKGVPASNLLCALSCLSANSNCFMFVIMGCSVNLAGGIVIVWRVLCSVT